MKRARRLAFVVLQVAALGLALRRTAHAQDRDATAAALQKFDQGRRDYEGGQFETALLAFEASNGMLASPNSLLYMARCYRALGRVASAHVHYQISARQAEERLVSTSEKRYVATRDAATQEAVEIANKVPRLFVAVPDSVPADFIVKRNGHVIVPGSLGAELDTDPGSVVIEASGHRMKPFVGKVQLEEGMRARVEVTVERLPTAVLVTRFVARPAGLSIRIDGESIDPRDLDAPREIDTGLHEITARAPGHVPFVWKRPLADGERVEVPIDLEPEATRASRTTPQWLFFAAAGASVATLATGTYFALRAKSTLDEELAKNPLERQPSRRDHIATQATLANALFASGAIMGAGAGVLAFTTKWREPQPSLEALIAPGSLGLSLRGPL